MNTLVRLALRVAVLAVIFYLVATFYDGISIQENTDATLGAAGTYLWVALLFALVNSLLGPLLRLLSLPFVLVTLGLFLLVINAVLLGITAGVSDRLQVDGIVAAIVGGFLIALASWVAELVLPVKLTA